MFEDVGDLVVDAFIPLLRLGRLMHVLGLDASPEQRAGPRVLDVDGQRAEEFLVHIAATPSSPSTPTWVVTRTVIAAPPVRTAPPVGTVVGVIGLIGAMRDDVDVGVLVDLLHPTSLELLGDERV